MFFGWVFFRFRQAHHTCAHVGPQHVREAKRNRPGPHVWVIERFWWGRAEAGERGLDENGEPSSNLAPLLQCRSSARLADARSGAQTRTKRYMPPMKKLLAMPTMRMRLSRATCTGRQFDGSSAAAGDSILFAHLLICTRDAPPRALGARR